MKRFATKRWHGPLRRSAFAGGLFALTLVLGALTGAWRVSAAGGAPLVEPGAIPPSATIAFSTAGLVSLFLSMFYQRRYQRADELVRELALVREPIHPDYRDMQRLARGWTPGEGIDPRWVDKHERTVKTISRFREYRQLFGAIPPFALVATSVFTCLTSVTILSWFLTMRFAPDWFTFGSLALFALTVEMLGQLLLILWRITLFPTRGEEEALHERLGIPSWYTLLDARQLSARGLPFSSVVANHEAYIHLSREGADWIVSLQLPLPLRGWLWACTVTGAEGELLSEQQGRVELSLAQTRPFFREAGLWLDVRMARWPCARTSPDRFAEVAVAIALSAEGDPSTLILTVPPRPGDGQWAWYEGRIRPGELNRYPWYALRYEGAGETAGGDVRLLRPAPDRGLPGG